MLGILLTLALLAGLTQWLRNLNDILPATAKLRHTPDVSMENFMVTAMGDTGKPEHTLEAGYMAHYPDDDSTELTKPHITVLRENDAPWHIYAERGWIAAGQNSILLSGAVQLENPKAGPSRAVSLTTSELRVLADEEYAETDQPVTIRSQTSVTRAVGMHAYLKEGRLQLLSKVRGSYAPKAKSKNR